MGTSWSSTRSSVRCYTRVRADPISLESGRWMNWEKPCRAKPGDTGGRKIAHEPSRCTCSPESQTYSGLHKKKGGRQAKWGDFFSFILLWWEPIWSTVSSSAVISTRQTWIWYIGSKRGPWKSWRISYAERLRALGVVLTGKKLQGGLQCMRGLVRKLETFYQACCWGTMGNGFKLKENRLDIKKTFFTIRMEIK